MSAMSNSRAGSIRGIMRSLAVLLLACLTLFAPLSAFAGKKKKADAPKVAPVLDYSNIVWPNPPAIARIRYLAFYAAQKLSQVDTAATKKAKWMHRLPRTQKTP